MSMRPEATLVAMSRGATAPLGLAQAKRAMAETVGSRRVQSLQVAQPDHLLASAID